MKYSVFFVVLILLLFTSCGSVVRTDYDRKVDFSTLNTYNYFVNIQWGETSPLDTARFIQSIDKELAEKGWTKSENPDVYIDIYPREREYKETTSTVGIGTGSWGRGIHVGGRVRIPIKQRKVEKEYVVEMVKAENENLIWQAVFNRSYRINADNEKVIANAMDKIFENFPPEKE